MVAKTVDRRGRLTLGKEFANRLVIVKELAAGTVQVTLAQAVPDREAWLHENPEAIAAVLKGLEQAKAGELVKGPDIGKLASDDDEGR
ncbi:MAG: hypothetical protein ABFD92_10875 [Planctomycetaceae bacterium]|nr:hypothetical protein [Planctomycetaceae bacterium]